MNTVIIFEIGTGLQAFQLNNIHNVTSLSFSKDGKYLSSGNQNG